MKTYLASSLLNQLEQQTESFLEKAITQWQMAFPSKLLQQPAENKWSVSQCLAHLNSYGSYYLPAIEKAIGKAEVNGWSAEEQFTPGLLGEYFTNLMTPDPKGKKIKKMSAPKNHMPAADLNSDNVLCEFIEQQERILKLLEQARNINLEKARVPVSIAKFIKLKLGDTFRFVVMHNYRHVLQAERALIAVGKKENTARFVL
jgi:hypothetical protein